MSPGGLQTIGYLLITVGTLAGSFFTVQQVDGVPVPELLGSLIVGVLGVVAARWGARAAATHEGKVEADLGTIGASLDRLVERIGTLDGRKAEVDVFELRHIIDREFPEDLDAFVQARESLIGRFGLQAYADIMNPFSAGERYINRVWSASTDGYVDETGEYLARAREQLEEARSVFLRLQGGADAPRGS